MSTDAWTAAAHRGKFDLEVYTRRAWIEHGVDPQCPYVARVHPDGLDTFDMAEPSLDSLLFFVREMEPRRVTVHGARGEDHVTLAALIEAVSGARRVH